MTKLALIVLILSCSSVYADIPDCGADYVPTIVGTPKWPGVNFGRSGPPEEVYVGFKLVVLAAGEIAKIELTESGPEFRHLPRFESSSIEALQQFRYPPTIEPCTTQYKFTFNLRPTDDETPNCEPSIAFQERGKFILPSEINGEYSATITLRFLVTTSGEAKNIHVKNVVASRDSLIEPLARAAIAATRESRYRLISEPCYNEMDYHIGVS